MYSILLPLLEAKIGQKYQTLFLRIKLVNFICLLHLTFHACWTLVAVGPEEGHRGYKAPANAESTSQRRQDSPLFSAPY